MISDLDCCKSFKKYKNNKFMGKYISNYTKSVCQYQNKTFCLSTPNFSIKGPSKLAHEKQLEWMLSRSKVGESSIGSYACCDDKSCSFSLYVDVSAYLKAQNHLISPSNSSDCLGAIPTSAVIYSNSLCKDSKLVVICPSLYQSGKCRFWGTECENPLLLTYQVTSCNETGGEVALSNNLSLSDSPVVTCQTPNPTEHSISEIVSIVTGVGSFIAAAIGVIIAYRKYKLLKRKLELVINSKNEDQTDE
ncbi:21047_t:CDS:1 [Racocetra persica]|uniref:21047_t:CDS:1 n=1 Tax=Racocetra persica TaxID=160502 RepID=A0ACA9QL28_9GLOM|nr:21047_t:CDS:1 [Racocetra persica]